MADASYVRDVDSIWQIIKDHEQETGSKYCVARSPRNFGNIDPGTNKPKKIYWDYSAVIPFCGMPFIILGTKVLDCQHGPDRNLAHKRRFKERCKSRPLMKHRCLKQETKKFNCPAQIRVHEVMMFKDFKITESTKRRKEVQSKALRDALGKGHVRNERRFYVNFPKPSAHTGHEVGQKDDAALDPVLINMIHKMVGVGVSSVTEMRRRLKTFVATKWPTGLPKPAKQDRKYYPSAHTIKKHMYGARVKRTENGTENETDSNGGEKSPTAEEQESDSVFHQSESYRKLDSAEQTAVQILCEGALEHDTVYVISEAVDCIPGATAQMEVREEVVDETQTINAYLNSCNELLVQINSLAHQIVHSSVLERLKHNLEDVKSQLEKDIQTEKSVSQLIYQVMP